METVGNQEKLIFENYFENLKKLISPKKKIFVNFDLKNFFLKTSLPYFKKLKIYHSKKSLWKFSSDQDNDRIFIFYKNKKILLDLVFYFLALEKKYQRLGVPIFFSKKLENLLKYKNKKIFYIKTGHINFKNAFKKYNLDLAFEPSGHFYLFKDLKTEAPYLAFAKFLILMQDKKLFDEFLRMKSEINLKRLDIDLKKDLDLEKLALSLKKKFALKLKKFDGFLLYNESVFFYLRKSKTENKLRVTIEIWSKKN